MPDEVSVSDIYDFEEYCAACGVYPRVDGGRYCESCGEVLVD